MPSRALVDRGSGAAGDAIGLLLPRAEALKPLYNVMKRKENDEVDVDIDDSDGEQDPTVQVQSILVETGLK